MYGYIKPLWKCSINKIVLLNRTNNAVNEPSWVVIGKLHDLKQYIKRILSESNNVTSNLLRWTDNNKPSLAVTKINQHLYVLQFDVIVNENSTSNELNKGGLHLNPRDSHKLQSSAKYLEQIREYTQNGTGPENSDLHFCIFFYRSF